VGGLKILFYSKLMQRRLIIHAGFPKSGTTALQASFRENADVLRAANIEYPPSQNDAHHAGVAALVGRSIGWQTSKPDLAAWDNFVRILKESNSQTILISSEFFTAANENQINRIKADFSEFTVQIFFTLRPLNRIVPSIYQQNLKKGSTLTYPEWISKKFMSPTGELRDQPNLINHANVIQKWAKVFQDRNIALIVGDSNKPELLYEYTSSLLGITQLKSVEKRALNRSLTVNECEVLRRINTSVKQKWNWDEYQKLIRQGYLKDLTATKSLSGEGQFHTPVFLQDVISNFAKTQIEIIRSLEILVLGNLQLFASVDDNQKGSPAIEESQVARDFKIVMGHLNWRRRKYRLKPNVIFRRLMDKLE